MVCVEQAGDASTMSTLQRCRELDPEFERTILVRNKLDKYFNDLTPANVNKWVQGFEDLPEDLNRPVRFAVTLPFWKDGQAPPEPFVQMRQNKSDEDFRTLLSKGLSEKYHRFVGFNNFASFMEQKIEQLFSEAIGPVLANLQSMKNAADSESRSLTVEYQETDPD